MGFHFVHIYNIVVNVLKEMSTYERLKTLFVEKGILSISDADCEEFPNSYFSALAREGFVHRIGAGVYSCPEHDATEALDYAEACRVAPNGVVCLFSALRLHGITLENPHRTHIALPRGARRPRTTLPVEFHSFSGAAYAFGIEERQSPDGPYKVYSVEKTIADCFKFRNAVGIDVAVAALKDAKEKRLLDPDRFWEALKVCRVARIARPYMEGVYA